MSLAIEDLKKFLDDSPTAWHATYEMGNRLALQDYTPLNESAPWHLEPGKGYFVCRNGSFIAFRLPLDKIHECIILASHTDSPGLKIKPNPSVVKKNLHLISTEVYGSPLLHSWLNRDLAIAGRVLFTNKLGNIEEKRVYIDDTLLCIPQLAIHLDRDLNEKGLILNKQDHTYALFGIADETQSIESLLRKSYSFEDLLSFDLFLVPVEKSRYLGIHQEFLSSYRIDNLISAHASITSLASCKPSAHKLQIVASWTHEEIGSATREGASGTFLQDVLEKIFSHQSLNRDNQHQIRANSLCVSIDMAHALHPSYEQKYEPQHHPHLGKGITIKYNANYKYATDAQSAAKIIQACKHLNLPYQSFTSRGDMPCGSTVGPIIAESLGIQTVDIGIPQLSMHSVREIMAVQDYNHLCFLLAYLFSQQSLETL